MASTTSINADGWELDGDDVHVVLWDESGAESFAVLRVSEERIPTGGRYVDVELREVSGAVAGVREWVSAHEDEIVERADALFAREALLPCD